MIKVGIVGATGYGGRELLRLLLAHPKAEVAAVASTTVAGQRLEEALPAYRKLSDLVFEDFDAAELARRCDVVFMAVPSKESMAPAAELRAEGVRVIDIGADFRLKNLADFREYYGTEHQASHLLDESVYGLVPFYRDALKDAGLVAVPGCYPISALLALRPLLDAPIADQPVIIDSISGLSGAGKGLAEGLHFSEMNENVRAYKVGTHQHIPELEQELLGKVMVQFTPHVGPYTRGILTTAYVRMAESFDPAPYFARYEAEPFVRVLGEGGLPELKYIRATNFCDIGWKRDERTGNLVLLSAIDNLNGGTAGMAVQCMNIMFGVEESTGLGFGGMTP